MNYYQENSKKYAEMTFNSEFAEVIFSKFPDIFNEGNGRRVLDIGFGSGRDAFYLHNKGFKVEAYDKEPKMVEEAKRLTGLRETFLVGSAECFKSKNRFDLAYSMACLLHLTDSQFNISMKNIIYHLNDDGVLFFTLKKGIGEEVDEMGRYFNYYTEKKILEKIKCYGVELISIEEVADLYRPEVSWFYILIKKLRG